VIQTPYQIAEAERRIEVVERAPGPPPGRSALYGYVRDIITKNPIPNATVIVDIDHVETTTDEEGYYEFLEVTPGTRTIRVKHPEYFDYVGVLYLEPDKVYEYNIMMINKWVGYAGIGIVVIGLVGYGIYEARRRGMI